MSTIRTLKLRNFRSYGDAALRDIGAGFVILHGANGAGKTNILEGISMLCAGRGLRGARAADIQKHDARAPWAVAAQLSTTYGPINIGSGLDARTGKRIAKINGEKTSSINALNEHFSCVWLTPQMDGLFIGSAGERRRFLDRFIFAFDRGHQGRLTRYAKAMSERSKLLRDQTNAPAWLDALEAQMAQTGIAIAAARIEFITRLSATKTATVHDTFPRATINVTGALEDLLCANTPSLKVEGIFKTHLRNSRGVDKITGGAAIGPHKSDMIVTYADKNMAAAQCSTGEQKALLIGLILAHALLLKGEQGRLPVILLDEVAAHLDADRCAALYDILGHIGAQVWFTGTELGLFTPIKGAARVFGIVESKII